MQPTAEVEQTRKHSTPTEDNLACSPTTTAQNQSTIQQGSARELISQVAGNPKTFKSDCILGHLQEQQFRISSEADADSIAHLLTATRKDPETSRWCLELLAEGYIHLSRSLITQLQALQKNRADVTPYSQTWNDLYAHDGSLSNTISKAVDSKNFNYYSEVFKSISAETPRGSENLSKLVELGLKFPHALIDLILDHRIEISRRQQILTPTDHVRRYILSDLCKALLSGITFAPYSEVKGQQNGLSTIPKYSLGQDHLLDPYAPLVFTSRANYLLDRLSQLLDFAKEVPGKGRLNSGGACSLLAPLLCAKENLSLREQACRVISKFDHVDSEVVKALVYSLRDPAITDQATQTLRALTPSEYKNPNLGHSFKSEYGWKMPWNSGPRFMPGNLWHFELSADVIDVHQDRKRIRALALPEIYRLTK